MRVVAYIAERRRQQREQITETLDGGVRHVESIPQRLALGVEHVKG